MGEAKRRKQLDPNYGKSAHNSVPPNKVRDWLYSPELRSWLNSHKRMNWEPFLSGLLGEILKDFNHDHIATTPTGDITIGVNLENWTLWLSCCSKDKSEIIDYPIDVWGQQIEAEHMTFP